MPIYDAAMAYQQVGVPLVVFGGKEYGMGSSRDWAAKGTMLLGIKAVLVESFERIHRSNLVGMGVLPLTLPEGVTRHSLGLTGEEVIDITGIGTITPRMAVPVTIRRADGTSEDGAGALPHRYRRRGGVLPPRRHPAIRAPRHGGGGLAGPESRPGLAGGRAATPRRMVRSLPAPAQARRSRAICNDVRMSDRISGCHRHGGAARCGVDMIRSSNQ